MLGESKNRSHFGHEPFCPITSSYSEAVRVVLQADGQGSDKVESRKGNRLQMGQTIIKLWLSHFQPDQYAQPKERWKNISFLGLDTN